MASQNPNKLPPLNNRGPAQFEGSEVFIMEIGERRSLLEPSEIEDIRALLARMSSIFSRMVGEPEFEPGASCCYSIYNDTLNRRPS